MVYYMLGGGQNQNREDPRYMPKGRDVFFHFKFTLEDSYAASRNPNDYKPPSRRKEEKEFTYEYPGLYFWSPCNKNIVLVGDTVNFYVAKNNGEYTDSENEDRTGDISWETDIGNSGTGGGVPKWWKKEECPTQR